MKTKDIMLIRKVDPGAEVLFVNPMIQGHNSLRNYQIILNMGTYCIFSETGIWPTIAFLAQLIRGPTTTENVFLKAQQTLSSGLMWLVTQYLHEQAFGIWEAVQYFVSQ